MSNVKTVTVPGGLGEADAAHVAKGVTFTSNSGIKQIGKMSLYVHLKLAKYNERLEEYMADKTYIDPDSGRLFSDTAYYITDDYETMSSPYIDITLEEYNKRYALYKEDNEYIDPESGKLFLETTYHVIDDIEKLERQSSNIEYEDTHNLGVDNVQDAVDYLLTNLTLTSDISIPTEGWVENTEFGCMKYVIENEKVTENDVVDINLGILSLDIANECGLKSITKSGNGNVTIYATEAPSEELNGTMIIKKVVV